ncbi:hypothetical protein AJ87_47590 [Rhizobium yanglingense]|nr:hypothetical protein AJ87_47590 [Rhizobium yanglingense]
MEESSNVVLFVMVSCRGTSSTAPTALEDRRCLNQGPSPASLPCSLRSPFALRASAAQSREEEKGFVLKFTEALCLASRR